MVEKPIRKFENENGATVLSATDTATGPVAIDPSVVAGALHVMSRSEIREDEPGDVRYARGLFVGMFSVLVGVGWPQWKAIALLKRYAPKDYHEDCIPETWREEWDECPEEPGE